MHPAFSVIAFTVCSGAGFGLFMLLVMAHVFGFVALERSTIMAGTMLAVFLISAGLIASTTHLANPKNAWRAFFRFRTSWLSREGVFAVLFYPFALLYLLGVYFSDTGSIGFFAKLMGLFGVMLSFATLFSQGMIYACLKTIKQWNTPLTPTNYILLAFATGALLFNLVLAIYGHESLGMMGGITLGLIFIATVAKGTYYFWIRTPSASSINTATGFARGKVRLLDVGHTAGTFLTEEFGYKTPQGRINLFKVLVFVCGFFVPFLLTTVMVVGAEAAVFSALLAFVVAMVGISLERWLFFAEANHVVNLYHGAQRT